MALAAQGFDRPRPARRVSTRDLSGTIHQLGLLQIDYVNVLVPAHYQVPYSRLGPYEKSQLDDLVYRRREFTEQWAHEASIVPVESWPLLRHRMESHRVRPWGFEVFLEQNVEYVAWILEEVRRAARSRRTRCPNETAFPGACPIRGSARCRGPRSRLISREVFSPWPSVGQISRAHSISLSD